MDQPAPVEGAGLGLRRAMLSELVAAMPAAVDFLELAPENWLRVGGPLRWKLDALCEVYPLTLHGLSLNIGGADPLDEALLRGIRDFMRERRITLYSEHLSYCASGGHLYDLLPLPFTAEAVEHVAARVRRVQDMLGCRLVLENPSYYLRAAPRSRIDEAEFIRAVAEASDCLLLLDVNNVIVNSINHAYDPVAFIDALPLERVVYLHVAGHHVEAPDLRIDTHGSDVDDAVWELLPAVYARTGPLPTLLERDFNFPGLESLLAELQQVSGLQARCRAAPRAAAQ